MGKEFINMREHVRIDVKIPFIVRKVREEEKNSIVSTIVGHYKSDIISTKQTTNETLNKWLNIINDKLDLILGLLTIQQHGFNNLPLSTINLSGGGLNFLDNKEYKKGDIVEIKAFLDIPVPIGVYLYGEVVRCEKKEEQFEVAVKFIKISEDIRDCIIRYIFHKETQMIRQTKTMD